MTIFTKSMSLAAVLAASVSGAAMAQMSTDSIAQTNGDGDASMAAGAGSEVGANIEIKNDTAVDLQEGVASQSTINAMNEGRDMLSSWTYAEVASSLNNKTALTADFGSISSSNSSTVMLSELKEADDETSDVQLNNALTANTAEITDMRSMIGANAELNAMIAANGHSADDVIGVYQTASGGYALLIDDRS